MVGYLSVKIKLAVQNKSRGHAMLEVLELIIIDVYGSTVFGVVGFIIANDCFLLTDGIVIQTRYEDSIHEK